MQCEYCAAEIKDNLKFCTNCGTRQKPVPKEQARPAISRMRFSWEEDADGMPVIHFRPVEPVREESASEPPEETPKSWLEAARERMRKLLGMAPPEGGSG